MQRSITIAEFCNHHRIETSFVQDLHEHGLLSQPSGEALDEEALADLERFVRLHYDLHINLEGLDVIQYMRRRIEALQSEMAALRNRLRFYESEL